MSVMVDTTITMGRGTRPDDSQPTPATAGSVAKPRDGDTMDSAAIRSSRRKPLARRTFELLVAEGYQPRLLPQEAPSQLLTFDHGGDRFFVQLDARDEDFFQVSLVRPLPIPRPTELAALRAAHDLQGSVKLVKIFIGREREFVEFQAPLLLGGNRVRPEIFRRCIGMLRSIAGAWATNLLATVTPVAHA